MVDGSFLFDAHTHQLYTGHRAIFQWTGDQVTTPDNYFSAGIHPEDAVQWNKEMASIIEQLAGNKWCLAIGETGLDTRIKVSMETQEDCFIAQLEIAEKKGKPVILHCVNSWDRARFLHSKYAPNTSLIYHGFNKASILTHVLNYPKAVVSVGQSVLTNAAIMKAVQDIPSERLLVETDNSDSAILEIYQQVARLKLVPLATFIETVNFNATRIFKL